MVAPLPRCILCDIPLWSSTHPACRDCTDKTGVVEMPPARRRTTPCSKCNHTKLVRAVPRELSTTAGPMFATYAIQRDRGGVLAPRVAAGYGVLEAYICKGCGFVEWYCQSPEEIPIGPAYMTEEIDLEATGPYR